MYDNYRALILSPSSPHDSIRLHKIQKNAATMVMDTLDNQVAELMKINHPSRTFTQDELRGKVEEYYRGRDKNSVGVWVYYPWRNTLVRILEEKDFVKLRTSRNKYKISKAEQDVLQTKKIGVIGLSVGQSVALTLAMERSFGELRIADFDTLDLSNMNRIRTGLYNLGIKKAWMVAREIAEIDPFLKVSVFEEGIKEENIDDFFTLEGKLDLLVEECDSLPIKIKSRLKAKFLGIPVLMDTSDKGMMDVERFDLDPNRPIFHGMLERFGQEHEILDKIKENHRELVMSILDFEQLSERAKKSIGQIGKTITTWPQTASSVLMGGAACAYYARKLLLNDPMASGRFYVDLDEYIKIPHED